MNEIQIRAKLMERINWMQIFFYLPFGFGFKYGYYSRGISQQIWTSNLSIFCPAVTEFLCLREKLLLQTVTAIQSNKQQGKKMKSNNNDSIIDYNIICVYMYSFRLSLLFPLVFLDFLFANSKNLEKRRHIYDQKKKKKKKSLLIFSAYKHIYIGVIGLVSDIFIFEETFGLWYIDTVRYMKKRLRTILQSLATTNSYAKSFGASLSHWTLIGFADVESLEWLTSWLTACTQIQAQRNYKFDKRYYYFVKVWNYLEKNNNGQF